jgi:hypothetical protein
MITPSRKVIDAAKAVSAHHSDRPAWFMIVLLLPTIRTPAPG